MKTAIRRIFISLFGLIISGYLIFVPMTMTGYTADQEMVVPDRAEAVQQTAMNFGNSRDPVVTVAGASEILGFNPKVDTFTLVKQDASQAIVRVFHNGANFDVTLELSPSGLWMISTMNSST